MDRITGKVVAWWSYCRQPICEVCKHRRSNLMTAMLFNQMGGRSCWHLTLTMQHGDGRLRPQVRRLFDAFTELRALAAWRHQIVGGARFLDVTHNSHRQTWGPHLHIVAEAKRINLMPIKSKWSKITGDSDQTVCRPIPEHRKDQLVLAKYVTKPPFESFAEDENLLMEYQRAMKNLKPARGFGEWHRLKLTPRGRYRGSTVEHVTTDGDHESAAFDAMVRSEAAAIMANCDNPIPIWP